MAGNVLAKMRSFVVRGLAVVAVVATYAVGSLGAQLATTLGISGLALTTSTTTADAQWRRGWRRGYWRRGYYRRGYWGGPWPFYGGPYWRRGYWRGW